MADVYVVMGVCGCGKSTVGRGLAKRTQGVFVEADAFHPPGNVQKMSQGIPLTDEDRQGWLEALRDRIAKELRRVGPPAFVTCSALKQTYRNTLDQAGPVRWIYLRGDEALLRQRLKARQDHYMPASLLDSQLSILEEPVDAIVADVAEAPEQIIDRLVEVLDASEGGTA